MHTAEISSWWRYGLVTAPLFVVIGSASGFVSNSGYGNDWFDALNKPAAMPPGLVFGVTWTCLYILLGVAVALILAAPRSKNKRPAIMLFGVQMLLNFAWSPVFFGLHRPVAALAIIFAILFASAAATAYFGRVRKAAAWLMTPYSGWLCFASWLNWQIIALNSG